MELHRTRHETVKGSYAYGRLRFAAPAETSVKGDDGLTNLRFAERIAGCPFAWI
jgi:hypothetical protein